MLRQWGSSFKRANYKMKLMFSIGVFLLLINLILSIFAPYIAPYDATKPAGKGFDPPNSQHIMGTNKLGYDVFSRVVYGTRTALEVGLLASIMALSLGLPLGLLSGYWGGKLDRLMVLIMDSLYSFPGLILALTVVAMIGPGMLNAALVAFVVFTPRYFRMVRNQALQVKEEDFIEASRAIGSPTWFILLRGILYNVIGSVAVIFSTNVAGAILILAGLSFLGLGITPPIPSLGYDLSAAQNYIDDGIWWLALFPGLFLVFIISSFAFIGEGLNDILNPPTKH